MVGIRKLVTKKEAVAEAFYISDILASNPGHPGWALTKQAWCDVEWSGKWKVSDYLIEGEDFEISAGRWKHLDGRIRDARSEAINTLGFAVFCAEFFPDRAASKLWRERLSNEMLVRATLDKPLRKWFVMPSTPRPSEVRQSLREAIILAKVSA
ncbi:hypothetical protein K3172_15370 [Qipengyuania sp. 6B39]|uniref:hypothetical protein n=1 Tax=Qipengyuania proteolytica TaxID=2867239 RepID=UPI001C89E63E|nr:hypothetical protein [Qipengyuania proteolytica]MBX7497239.1 hypothetical protein [Qipengyuania proteolytica]